MCPLDFISIVSMRAAETEAQLKSNPKLVLFLLIIGSQFQMPQATPPTTDKVTCMCT